MHHSSGIVTDALHAANPLGTRWPAKATVELGEGDSSWNPASTKRVISGPCRVQYEQHQDGGIDAYVLDRMNNRRVEQVS